MDQAVKAERRRANRGDETGSAAGNRGNESPAAAGADDGGLWPAAEYMPFFSDQQHDGRQ